MHADRPNGVTYDDDGGGGVDLVIRGRLAIVPRRSRPVIVPVLPVLLPSLSFPTTGRYVIIICIL